MGAKEAGMHDDMGGNGHDDMGAMTMPLLPSWLRVVWIVALCAVIVLHIAHAWAMPGQRRWWHLGHTAMAAGMALMYALPRMQYTGLYRAGLVLFAVITVATAVTTVVFRWREGRANPLWALSTIDMLAMTYMLAPPETRPDWVNYAVAGYLAVQTVAWLFGLWDRLPVFRVPVAAGNGTRTAGSTAVSGFAATAEHVPAQLDADPHPEVKTGPVVGLTAHSTIAVHVTLAVMVASMAYMLLVM